MALHCALVGHLPGGLGVAGVMSSAIFAACQRDSLQSGLNIYRSRNGGSEDRISAQISSSTESTMKRFQLMPTSQFA